MKIRLVLKLYNDKYKKESSNLGRITDVLNRCHQVNEWRIRVAHGTWFIGPDSSLSAQHFARNSLRIMTYYQEKDELRKQTKKVDQIRRDMLDFLKSESDSALETSYDELDD